MLSVVVPVYMNEDFVSSLIEEFQRIAADVRHTYAHAVEFVFVVDGSPDASYLRLAQALPAASFASQLIDHSRNFGSFAAIRSGLEAGRGDYFAVVAADLQEPPELLLDFVRALVSGHADVAVGRRESRHDPLVSRLSAGLFWWLYRRAVIKDVPPGGVDVFACTRAVRDQLLRLSETHSSLVGQLFWLGYRRVEIAYERRARAHGRSAWTWRKKLRYLSDSVFAFTDLPIRILLTLGALGLVIATVLGASVVALRLAGLVQVPGYAATMLVLLFFGALNMFGLGVVGSYAARAYENTKGRPVAVVRSSSQFGGAGADGLTEERRLAREAS